MRVANLDCDALDAELRCRTSQRSVLAAVVENDLRVAEEAHLGSDRIEHIGANVVGIDAAEAGRVQVDVVVEVAYQLLEQLVTKDLRREAARLAWEGAVEVVAITELAAVREIARDVDTRHGHHWRGICKRETRICLSYISVEGEIGTVAIPLPFNFDTRMLAIKRWMQGTPLSSLPCTAAVMPRTGPGY